MQYLNEQALKAMVSQKYEGFYAESRNAQLLNSVLDSNEEKAVVVNPVRRKMGIMLMRWGMQLAGVAK